MSDSTKCGDFQSNDLVKRLRDRGVCSLAHNSCRNDFVCEEAADRIEKLESDLWSMAVDHLAAEERANEAYQARLEAETKLAECEARLCKAVEALDEAHTSMLNNYDGAAFLILDIALAELEGETDE